MLFFNHAATSPISPKSSQAMQRYVGEYLTKPLSSHFYYSLGLIEETREKLAQLMGVSAQELAFCTNTSSALSLIAHGINWRQGDVVLAPEDEFNSNLFVWQNLKAKGVELRTFQPSPSFPIDAILEQIPLKRVRLITLSAVSYQSGRLYELERFARFCQERGIYSCLDAIQALGATPLALGKLGIDFAAFGGQKWLLGPIGCGFFYVRKKLLDTMHVTMVGWTSALYAERLAQRNLEFTRELARFEPGLPNIIPIVGLKQALEELEEWGWNRVFEEIDQKRAFLEEQLSFLPSMLAKESARAGIYSARLTQEEAQLLQTHFEQQQLIATVRSLTPGAIEGKRSFFLRLSPHIATTQKQLYKAVNIIKEALTSTTKVSIAKPPRGELGRVEEPGRLQKEPAPMSKRLVMVGFLPRNSCDLEGSLSSELLKEMLLRHQISQLCFIAPHKEKSEAPYMQETFPPQLTKTLQAQAQEQQMTIKSYRSNLWEEAGEKEQALQKLIEEIEHAPQREPTKTYYIWCTHTLRIERSELLQDEELTALYQAHVGAFERLCIALMQSTHASSSSTSPTSPLTATNRAILLLLQPLWITPLPYSSAYHAACTALFIFARSLALEQKKKLPITLFFSPPCHSKLQKKSGRFYLRFWKSKRNFSHFAAPQKVAQKACKALVEEKELVLSWRDRLFFALCFLFPSLHQRMLEKKRAHQS